MIDLLSISKSTDNYNFHSHTQFCDGRANMEDFVKAAVEEGILHYGFSPHGPVKIESPCNMPFSTVEPYLAEVERLRGIYGGKISLYASMEVDYFDDWNATDPYFHSLGLDYIIGSVHFIPSFVNPREYVDIDGCYEAFNRKMGEYFHNDIEAVVRSFYAQSMKMIEKGGFGMRNWCALSLRLLWIMDILLR